MPVDTTRDEVIDAIAADMEVAALEAAYTRRLTLADLIRAGSPRTTQAFDWGHGANVCALSTAAYAALAAGVIEA